MGNWSLGLDLYDCDPEIDVVQICDGVASDPVRRHIYVDSTPPVFTNGGPGVGTYDRARGDWTIGTMSPNGSAELDLGAKVNAAGTPATPT